jgi:formyl-CoA transferase
MIETVDVPALGRTLKVPGMAPKLSVTPGQTLWGGCELGQHSEEVLCGILGYDAAKVDALIKDGSVLWPDHVPRPAPTTRAGAAGASVKT